MVQSNGRFETMKKTGAQIIVECLLEQGVDTVFGYPGGAVLNIYDALYEYSDKIRHVLTAHEQGASHAADGYARTTGKTGVVIATSGPGATNLVTGIATAYMDSIPMVAVTGNVAVPLLGRDSFQEVDITGITMPITKHNFIVKDVKDLADTIRKAFVIAKSGRPAPVLIDIPKDVTANKTEYQKKEIQPVVPSENVCEEDIENAVKMIQKSKKPYVFIGGGAVLSGASEEIRTFVKKVDAPVTDSLMGKGAFPGTDSLYTGMLGMHGTKTANYGVSECDLLIVLGARFSDRVTGNAKKFAKNAKILQFDIDAAEMNKNILITDGVVGDLNVVLRKINEQLEQQSHEEWVQKIMEYKTIVADQVKEKGQIIVPELEEAVFKDNEQAAVLYQEVAEQQQIPKIPVYVSKKTERKLGKKQKLVTDSGIELLVPLELLKDESILEYHQNDDGKMSILIKEIGFIENK